MYFGFQNVDSRRVPIDQISLSGFGLGFVCTRPCLDHLDTRVPPIDYVSRSASAVVEMCLEVCIKLRVGGVPDVDIIGMGRADPVYLAASVLADGGRLRRPDHKVQLLDRLGL